MDPERAKESQRCPEMPRETSKPQRSLERPRGEPREAQAGPERPKYAQRGLEGPERPREASRCPQRPREAQRGLDRPR